MKKRIIFMLLITMLLPSLFGQEKANIKEFSGKVTFKVSGRDWLPVSAGLEIGMGTMLSTGFNANAVLDLGTAVVIMKPLTRMTLKDLIRTEGTVTTKLYLNVGRITAKVKTVEGVTNNFTLLSTLSVASVRGTEFEFDGERIKSIEGAVIISNLAGQTRTVMAGEVIETTPYETPAPAVEQRIAAAEVSTSTSPVTPPAVSLADEQVVEAVLVTGNVQDITLTID